VQFVAGATDAQSVYQSLTFSLSNAPVGASINVSSGGFTWVTTNAAVPSTNVITVRVTDTGTPALSDTKTFAIGVSAPPRFNSVNSTGDGDVQISFNSLPGRNYQLQFKDHLTDPTWTALGTAISGTGAAVSIFDEISGQPQRFYRLLALP
jgi:hypothetical protein